MDKKLFEIICAKDETPARNAAEQLINNTEIKEFEQLCDKMDFLFDFVRENVYKRLNFAINKNNYKNVLKFWDCYCTYFDDFFASTLAKYANEDLTDEILEILSKGSENQKAYAAGYFKKIPDTVAKDDLICNLSTDFEPLFINCAEALGKMDDEQSFEKYLNNLISDDEFIKLNAIKFLTAYGRKDIYDELLTAMKNSGMSENIAGEIVNLISPLELFKTNFSKGACLFNNLINGLGEILPLENIFFYEIYEVTEFLFSNTHLFETPVLLYNLKNKFNTLTQNEEYVFDLDKNTKNEVFGINKLLNSKSVDFWNNLKIKLKDVLKTENYYTSTILEIVKNEQFIDFGDDLINLAYSSENETLICEIVSVLKELGLVQKIDKSKFDIKNPNIKAVFEQILNS